MLLRSAVVSLLLFTAAMLHAQTPDTATLNGEVQDSTHARVAGASITLEDPSLNLRRTVKTNARGEFSIEALPIRGNYALDATGQGFAAAHLDHVMLGGGSTARVVVRLNVNAAQSDVTVEGTAADVTLEQPEAGIRLSEREIEATPLLNRRITFLPLLNAANRPAISQGDIFMNQNLFTTSGGGRRQQAFVVDGASGNDSWGRQTIFTNIPQDAVLELDVLTQSFSAEYGASTGSVVNIITRSGTDRLHGSVLELYRPADIEARLNFNPAAATSGNQITGDQLAQTAISVGGRLFPKDPTYFFFAGEFSRQRRTSAVTSALNPGTFVGHYRDFLGNLRLDRELTARNSAFLRADADGFYDTNPNGIVGGQTLPSVARTFRRKTYTVELGDTAILSPALVNNLRVQFQLASPITEFDPVVPGTQFSVPIFGQPTFTSGTSQSALLQNRQYGVDETLSATRGKHQFVVGGDWLFAHTGGDSKEFGGPYFLGRFVYNTCQPAGLTGAALIAYCESPAFLDNIANVASYTQGFGNPTYTVNDNLFAFFAQDNYRLTHRLTLNVGLRYEQQTFTDSRTNFEPRVGFVFDPHGSGETIVRAGFGMYYSQIVDNSEANYVLSGPQYVNYTATPGTIGFPTSVAAAPLPVLTPGAPVPTRSLYIRPGNSAYLNQFFPTSTLHNYPGALLNPYSEQYTAGVEQRLAANTILDLDFVGTHTVHNVRPLDVDPPPLTFAPATPSPSARPPPPTAPVRTGSTTTPSEASLAPPPISLRRSSMSSRATSTMATPITTRSTST